MEHTKAPPLFFQLALRGKIKFVFCFFLLFFFDQNTSAESWVKKKEEEEEPQDKKWEREKVSFFFNTHCWVWRALVAAAEKFSSVATAVLAGS